MDIWAQYSKSLCVKVNLVIDEKSKQFLALLVADTKLIWAQVETPIKGRNARFPTVKTSNGLQSMGCSENHLPQPRE
jgi:hypothetical protein